VRGNGRREAHKQLPVEVRQQLVDAISAGRPFRATVKDLGLASNQVWGLTTKTDQHWAAALEAALMASRRDDLKHGTNAAYVHGCVCRECRAHQRIRMDKREQGEQEDADQHHSTGDVRDAEFVSCVTAARETRSDDDFNAVVGYLVPSTKDAGLPDEIIGAGTAVAAIESGIVESGLSLS
jgi:hypothetical protein